jgi:hypothetical protein
MPPGSWPLDYRRVAQPRIHRPPPRRIRTLAKRPNSRRTPRHHSQPTQQPASHCCRPLFARSLGSVLAMNSPTVDPNNPPNVYRWTGPTGVEFEQRRSPNTGTYYHTSTPREVVDILDRAQGSRARLRMIFLGDAATGKAWSSEWRNIGTVGRSTGWLKVPLLIHRPAMLACTRRKRAKPSPRRPSAPTRARRP